MERVLATCVDYHRPRQVFEVMKCTVLPFGGRFRVFFGDQLLNIILDKLRHFPRRDCTLLNHR